MLTLASLQPQQLFLYVQTGSDLLMQSSLNANYDDKKTETQEQD